MTIKHGDELPEKQIRSSKLMTIQFNSIQFNV